jgi:N utilization substance protein B
MARVDLAILRLAAYELAHRDDVPPAVSINEAVELSRRFSTEGAGAFINGILGSLHRTLEAGG